ncbi:unnamed protein product [Alternaria alternata]
MLQDDDPTIPFPTGNERLILESVYQDIVADMHDFEELNIHVDIRGIDIEDFAVIRALNTFFSIVAGDSVKHPGSCIVQLIFISDKDIENIIQAMISQQSPIFLVRFYHSTAAEYLEKWRRVPSLASLALCAELRIIETSSSRTYVDLEIRPRLSVCVAQSV